jgi:hypothetical protein
MAEQPSAMLASHMLAEAIAELHGVPGKKDRRKELRHRLVDVQAGISEEMSAFSHPNNLEELVKRVEQQMQHPSLRDRLFVFAALARSPDPAQLNEQAVKTIREHPLSSLFGASHHDREGKVVHRSEGAGFGDGADNSAISGRSRRKKASGAISGRRAKSGSPGRRSRASTTFLKKYSPGFLCTVRSYRRTLS